MIRVSIWWYGYKNKMSTVAALVSGMCSIGTIKQHYKRNHFAICKQNLLIIDEKFLGERNIAQRTNFSTKHMQGIFVQSEVPH